MAAQQFITRYLRVGSCPRSSIVNNVNSLVLYQYGRNSSRECRIPNVQVTKQLWTPVRPFCHSELMIQNKLQMLLPIVISSRGKKSSRKPSGKDVLSDDDDDDGDFEDWEVESGLDYKDFKMKVSSLRLDSILKSGLKMSRNKVENAFYSSRIRINEQKVLKKSKQLEEGDEVDLIKGISKENPEMINIARLILVKVGDYDEETDKQAVLLRRYQNLLIRKYDNFKISEE